MNMMTSFQKIPQRTKHPLKQKRKEVLQERNLRIKKRQMKSRQGWIQYLSPLMGQI